MSTPRLLQRKVVFLLAVTALSWMSIQLAGAEQPKKLAEECVFSPMEDPCRHNGQADARGPIRTTDLQPPAQLVDNCVFSFMEDPCRHVGKVYVNGSQESNASTNQAYTQTTSKLPEECVFSAMEDPCRHVRRAPTVGLTK